jgi:hypothetical protein
MTAENDNSAQIISFFDMAKRTIIAEGYEPEIDMVQERFFDQMDEESLFWETTFVLLASSGLKEQIVQKNFDRFRDAWLGLNKVDDPFTMIRNGRQREAIKYVWKNKAGILKQIRDQPTIEKRIEFLDTLPQIGPITRYHLARNLGMDFIKPDIWMDRLTAKFGYNNPVEMCEVIRKHRPEWRLGTIDVILWRYCNLVGVS